MSISVRLQAYLALERAMVNLDREKDPLADKLRDCMDPIWFALSSEEQVLLDARTGDISDFAGSVPESKRTVAGTSKNEAIAAILRQEGFWPRKRAA